MINFTKGGSGWCDREWPGEWGGGVYFRWMKKLETWRMRYKPMFSHFKFFSDIDLYFSCLKNQREIVIWKRQADRDVMFVSYARIFHWAPGGPVLISPWLTLCGLNISQLVGISVSFYLLIKHMDEMGKCLQMCGSGGLACSSKGCSGSTPQLSWGQ